MRFCIFLSHSGDECRERAPATRFDTGIVQKRHPNQAAIVSRENVVNRNGGLMTSSAYITAPPAIASHAAIAYAWRGVAEPRCGYKPAYPTWPQATSGAGGGEESPLDPISANIIIISCSVSVVSVFVCGKNLERYCAYYEAFAINLDCNPPLE